MLAGCTGSEPTVQGAPADPALVLPIAFGLQRDYDGLAAAAHAASTPRDPAFRAWRSASDIADAFGAPTDVVQLALATVREAGFDGDVDPTRGALVGTMTVADAEAFLGVTIVLTETPDGPIARPDRPLHVPDAVSGQVTEVVGTSMLLGDPPEPEGSSGPPTSCARPANLVDVLRAQYGLEDFSKTRAAGAGVRVGLLSVNPFSQQALDTYAQCYHRAVPVVTEHVVGPSPGPGADSTEPTLDILALSLIAPGVTEVDLYRANPFTTVFFALQAAIADGLDPRGPSIISTSVAFCETEISDAAMAMSEWQLAAGALAGVTVVSSSGDTGSSGCVPATNDQLPQYPASSPWVTGVGGTQYASRQAEAAVLADPRQAMATGTEAVWNQSPGTLAASGGATTSRLPRPSFQDGVVDGDHRVVPDVAFLAAPASYGQIPICSATGCVFQQFGGTSATAPGFAGALAAFAAETDARMSRGNRIGAINTALYALAQRSDAADVFNDVTAGTNDLYGVGCCTAGPGYDAATGWGSVDFASLIDRYTAWTAPAE